MDSKRIYFRVDGGLVIGLGHIIRCMALAQMLSEDFQIEFICKEIPNDNLRELAKVGFSVTTIVTENDFLSRLSPDEIVVVDHYTLDSNYQKGIKDIGCKLVCIDDLHDKEFFADVVINTAPNINPSDYQAQFYTQFALGPNYALLRPAFLNKLKENNHYQPIKIVFICFGGADPKNITQTIVDLVKNDKRFEKIIVVTGSAYCELPALKKSVESDNRFFLYHSIDSEIMVSLMSESQLAIVPSSGILQEVLAIGCKVISGIYALNQTYLFENYKALKAFESAEDFSKANLTNAINKCFNNRSNAPKLIDGQSNKRLKSLFKQLAEEHLVSLKRIDGNDLRKTFEWATNKEIRKFSFSQGAIAYEEHKKWFTDKLKDKNCYYYIGALGSQTFGSVRFDINNDTAKISYLVDPLYQGRGLGAIILKKGLEALLKESRNNITKVCGEVMKQNQASIKIFERLGYSVQKGVSNNFIRFEKKLQHRFRFEK